MAGEMNREQSNIPSVQAYSKKYMIILIIILGLAHVLDEYATLAPGMVQSSIIDEFFVKTGWKTQTEALQFMAVLGIVGIFVAMAAQVFKSLQDRVGRKPIFMIAVLGMMLGILGMILAPSFWPYFASSAVLTFFVSNDMQYMYIQEEAPARRRAQFFSYAKILGLTGLLLVPLIRSFTVVEGSENWRPVLYLPIIIGVIVLLLSFFFLKETRAYRVYKQEKAAQKAETGEETKEPSLPAAFKTLRTIPTWPQVKWLIIIGLFSVPFLPLNQAYSEIFMDQAGVSLADRNLVLVVSTISVGIAYFLSGVLADRTGRKRTILINVAVMGVGLVIEYFAMWAAPDSSFKIPLLIIAGVSQGLRIGAFWNQGDLRNMMLIESTPTHLRGNTQAIAGMLIILAIVPFTIINSVLIGLFPGNVQAVLLILGIPVALLILIFTKLKTEETVDVDILAIEG